MRRAQSTRHHPRPSLALGADDLGVLNESGAMEDMEDALRRQLLERDRLCSKYQSEIATLHAELSKRPSEDRVRNLESELKSLDILLMGTQRDNERCMTELERGKTEIRMLQNHLRNVVGENWREILNVSSSPTDSSTVPPRSTALRQNSSVTSLPEQQDPQQAAMNFQQIRTLILGMEERLSKRETRLEGEITRAQQEGKKFEELSRKLPA